MDRYLLDTQIVMWLANEPEKVSVSGCDVILNKDNELYFCYASVWELSIKESIGKLKLNIPLQDFISEEIEKHSLILLPVSLTSIYHNQHLPLIHKDPFDRILAAQSIIEKLPLISADRIFDDYDIKRIW